MVRISNLLDLIMIKDCFYSENKALERILP